MIPLGQHPLPRHTVAHLSDPHLLADGARVGDLSAPLDRVQRVDVLPPFAGG